MSTRGKRGQDTESKQATKRAKGKEKENSDPQLPQSSDKLQQDYDKLKAKYDELKNLRHTESERLYEELKKNSGEKEEAAKTLINQYKAEITKLQEGSSGKNGGKEASKLRADIAKREIEALELNSKLKQAEEANERAKKMIAVFEAFAGMKAERLEEDKYMFECMHTSQSDKVIKFVLFFQREDDEVEYSPLSHQKVQLPEYLTQTITFEESALPQFLTKILTNLYKAPKEDEQTDEVE